MGRETRWHGLGPKLALSAASLLVCGALCEAVVRIRLDTGVPGVVIPLRGTIVLDRELGWRVNPEYRDRFEVSAAGASSPAEVSFASNGFREYGSSSSSKPRLMVVGDSFTQAEDVPNGRPYYSVLGSLTGREIFAYGCNGYGTLQELQVLTRYWQAIRPSAVVWQFCSNDLVNNDLELESDSSRNNNGLMRPYWVNGQIEYAVPKPYFERTVRATLGWSRFATFAFGQLDRARAISPDDTVERQLETQGFAHAGFARSLRTTDELLAQVRVRVGAVPVYLLYVNGIHPGEDAPVRKALADLSAKHGFSFVDSAEVIGPAEASGREVRGPDHAHWNETGHELVAGLLARALERPPAR